VGIGGEGGYTLESLVRSGVSNITIIDYDIFDSTNLNRQIIATESNIGFSKVEEAYKRYTSINKNLNIKIVKECLTSENINALINESYDYIVDACDDINAKVNIIKYALEHDIKVISCMGTAKKMDATKLEITRLDKTEYDPLAKKLRSLLKEDGLSLKIPVISSKEVPQQMEKLGTNSYVPGVAGLYITNYIINDLMK
jgi:tRNA A37 threonylcarbamoyladenosine dehydratase